MGSPLVDMPRETPFQVPAEYFRLTLKQVMERIHEGSDQALDTPEAELHSLSPLLAEADRKMPFRLSADNIPVPRELLSDIGIPKWSESPLPTEAAQPMATVRTLTPLRAAAAVLVLGATAWFLRTQIPSAEAPAIESTAQAQPPAMDSINDQALDGFIRDTEIVTAYETIGTEVAWTDAFKDIASGDRSALDSELASVPESSLMAYVNETGINSPRP